MAHVLYTPERLNPGEQTRHAQTIMSGPPEVSPCNAKSPASEISGRVTLSSLPTPTPSLGRVHLRSIRYAVIRAEGTAQASLLSIRCPRMPICACEVLFMTPHMALDCRCIWAMHIYTERNTQYGQPASRHTQQSVRAITISPSTKASTYLIPPSCTSASASASSTSSCVRLRPVLQLPRSERPHRTRIPLPHPIIGNHPPRILPHASVSHLSTSLPPHC